MPSPTPYDTTSCGSTVKKPNTNVIRKPGSAPTARFC
ncbi:hypothetical protein Barb4_04333 [Bacteroidales bacterium Barb4]|nr:hypothetical protein Barb4_04333 [Bacteroidales bacterium Barb4]